jgi:hypothetical protein
MYFDLKKTTKKLLNHSPHSPELRWVTGLEPM